MVVGGFTHVSGEHTTRLMLYGEPTKSRYGSAYQAILEGSKACVEISKRHYIVQIVVQVDRGSEVARLHGCGLGW